MSAADWAAIGMGVVLVLMVAHGAVRDVRDRRRARHAIARTLRTRAARERTNRRESL